LLNLGVYYIFVVLKHLDTAYMKTPDTSADKPARKPQVNLQLEAWEKKLFEDVAVARGNVGVSALLRLLVVDEARRLGIPVNPPA